MRIGAVGVFLFFFLCLVVIYRRMRGSPQGSLRYSPIMARTRAVSRRSMSSRTSVGSRALVPVTKAQAERNLARKVQELSKYVKGFKPEMKFIDISLSTLNISQAGGLTLLMSAISQATAVNARIGENVQVRYIEMHGEVSYASSVALAVNDNPTYRVYIVQDKQQVASTSPALSDLVDQPGNPVYQLRNVQEQKRFRVIYDSGPQVLAFGNFVTPPTNSNVVMQARYHLHLKKRVSIPVEFNGSAATQIQKNGIYFMLSTDMIGAGATSVLDWAGSSRVGFTDS